MWAGLFKGRAASPSVAVEGVNKIKTWEGLSAGAVEMWGWGPTYENTFEHTARLTDTLPENGSST